MNEEQVGDIEKREIRGQVDRILRDLGRSEPPLNLSDVRSLLSLNLQYYSSSEPSIVAELTHRFTLLTQKTIPDLGRLLQAALSKSRLCAFWVPDASKIMIDTKVPKPKHRWIEAHEITHSITPWHRGFLLGDNSQTLDPACHATLEAEANFGAARLLFLQDRFSKEARDLALSFDSIKLLAKRYNNSIVSTFWRTVEDRNPNQPVFGMVSIHSHHPDIGKHDGPKPWRYFIRSTAFQMQFSNVSPEISYRLIATHARTQKTGPVFSAHDILQDVAGNSWEFQIESFSTKHALLTIGFPTR
jgi:hypothetical protein